MHGSSIVRGPREAEGPIETDIDSVVAPVPGCGHPGYPGSELAVVIRAGDDLFGVLDIASMEPEAFNEEDEKAVSLVADKLAEQFMAERR